MNNLKVVIPAIIIFILAIGGVYYLYKSQVIDDTTPLAATATPQGSAFPQVTGTPSASPSTNVGSQPATGSDELKVYNVGIYVNTPTFNQKITSPLKVSGKANVTSQKVVARVKDSDGNVLGQAEAAACVGLDACPFEMTISFSKPSTVYGTLEIYSPSTVNSEQKHLQFIQISF